MVRSKRGERERRAERVGECTGWGVRLGKQLVGSTLDAIRDGEHWRRLVIALHCGGRWHRLVVIRFHSALTSFFPWAVDAGGVALVAGVRPVVACGGCAWFSWALVIVCALSCCLRIVVLFVHCHVVCAMSCCLHDVVLFACLHCLC